MRSSNANHNVNEVASKYANLLSGSRLNTEFREQDKEKQHVSYNAETTKTVVLYLLNLISMIFMCILVVGILIITLIVWLEGSL
jgi:hypothetical protein